jgi:hypothetical protein
MLNHSHRATGLFAASALIAAGALLGACAPPPDTTGGLPAPVTEATTTVNVTYSCIGVGFAASVPPAALPDQVVSVTIGHPTSPVHGSTFQVVVTNGTFALSAASPAVNLNAAGLGGQTILSANAGTIPNAFGSPVYFTGNGVTGTIPWAAVNATAPASGASMTITTGVVNILSGSTGFVCTPVGPSASVVLPLS